MRRQVGFHEAFLSVIVQWNCTISGHIAVRQHYIYILHLDLEEVEFIGRLYYYYAMGQRRVFSERHYLWIYHYVFLPYYAHNGLYVLMDCMLNLVRFFRLLSVQACTRFTTNASVSYEVTNICYKRRLLEIDRKSFSFGARSSTSNDFTVITYEKD